MIFVNWTDTVTQGVQQFGIGFIRFVPSLIAAIVIFVIGWFVAVAVGKLIIEILKRLKLDSFLDKTGWKEAMNKVEIQMTVSEFLGSLCKWILVLLFLAISAKIINLDAFYTFILAVVAWLPKLVVAVLVFIATVVVANFAEKATKAAMSKAKIEYANLAGSIVRWATWIFGIFAILLQLGVMRDLILVIFWGLVGMLALAGGLAFGLGGKDAAADLINALKQKIKK